MTKIVLVQLMCAPLCWPIIDTVLVNDGISIRWNHNIYQPWPFVLHFFSIRNDLGSLTDLTKTPVNCHLEAWKSVGEVICVMKPLLNWGIVPYVAITFESAQTQWELEVVKALESDWASFTLLAAHIEALSNGEHASHRSHVDPCSQSVQRSWHHLKSLVRNTRSINRTQWQMALTSKARCFETCRNADNWSFELSQSQAEGKAGREPMFISQGIDPFLDKACRLRVLHHW